MNTYIQSIFAMRQKDFVFYKGKLLLNNESTPPIPNILNDADRITSFNGNMYWEFDDEIINLVDDSEIREFIAKLDSMDIKYAITETSGEPSVEEGDPLYFDVYCNMNVYSPGE